MFQNPPQHAGQDRSNDATPSKHQVHRQERHGGDGQPDGEYQQIHWASIGPLAPRGAMPGPQMTRGRASCQHGEEVDWRALCWHSRSALTPEEPLSGHAGLYHLRRQGVALLCATGDFRVKLGNQFRALRRRYGFVRPIHHV